MPFNLPGILVPFQLIIYPRLVIPSLIVKDIRHLDFPALKRAGYRGAVFDKDNCLTIPYKDTLVPELEEAWQSCRDTFGEGNVVVVSNSAGTGLDAGGIQAESVQHYLQVPVLLHKSFKPAYSCIASINTYFSRLERPIQPNELIIVGDRIFTDVVMANRMKLQSAKQRSPALQDEKSLSGTEADPSSPVGPLAIWTTGVWEKEGMLMRRMEGQLLNAVERWSNPSLIDQIDTRQFLRSPVVAPEPAKRTSIFDSLISRFRTA